ncbi:GGDEF domain-containing protein [Aestuariirhabdus litorea]|uniref:diguanylate cyclase n=1 Tax=Aestuariirhabdus litorea TaxID=2528527 RepID=A0A3P3VSG6_9GAMM|nr:GGDEF domain-containing protein [Aestuariirhabdus litorea]RRJ85257.1 GGDEF domain-containing protein [Aestuariirhabdus litorea]RWW98478.1 diguanylate cyclase [Endozoicomonadaceae bacterium GTF-13]
MLSQLVHSLNTHFHLADLIAAKNHSDDFNYTRAGYIARRVRVLTFSFALLGILWIPVDLATLSGDYAFSITIARVVLAGALLVIGLSSFKLRSLNQNRVLLGLLLLALGGFYFYAQWVLGEAGRQGFAMGYSFLPFVYIAALTIFPLSLREGFVAGVLVLVWLVLAHLMRGGLMTTPALLDFWLISLLMMIALWAQASYLNLLLRLYRQATTDPLTGLFNRAMLMSNMELAISEAQPDEHFAILMFDLDYFKRINDTYGHMTGDEVLREFAKLVKAHLRPTDVVGRYGGEEFVALLRDVDEQQAQKMAERLRQACELHPIKTPGGETLNFTTSIGVTLSGPGNSIQSLLEKVDDLLYDAKHNGRNRVTFVSMAA